MRKAYLKDNSLVTIIASPVFQPALTQLRNDVIALLKIAMDNNLPAASLAASLNYFDACIAEQLPANLIQAQRDYFGAHTYERTDKEGIFHSEWEEKPAVMTSAQKPKED